MEREKVSRVLTLDDEYRREIDEALKLYLQRLGEADEFMARGTVEEFCSALLSGQDPIPATSAYERLAGQERDLTLRLAAVRLAMRQMRTGK
jgi:hypothetical protein